MEVRDWPDFGAVWPLARLPLPGGGVRLVVAGQLGGVWAWDPVTGTSVTVFEVRSAVNDMVVCWPVGRGPVLVVATDGGVEWFDALTGGSQFGPTTRDTVWGLAVAEAADGTVTVFGAGYLGPYPVYRWDASSGVMQPDLGGHDNHIVAVTVVAVPDGTSLVAAGGWAGTIHRWNPVTGQPYGAPMAGHGGIIVAVDTVRLPDGRLLLVSADTLGEIRRWDAVTGSPIGRPFTAHPGATTITAARTDTGVWLLTSGGEDQVIRRWDPLTGEHLGDLGPGYAPVVLHIDGKPIVAAGGAHGLSLYPLPD